MIGAPCARRFSCTDTLHTSVARMLCVRLSLRHTSSAPDFVSVHPRCSKRFDRAPGQSHGSNTFCASVLKSQTARSRSNASSVSFFMHAQYRECSDSYENSRHGQGAARNHCGSDRRKRQSPKDLSSKHLDHGRQSEQRNLDIHRTTSFWTVVLILWPGVYKAAKDV